MSASRLPSLCLPARLTCEYVLPEQQGKGYGRKLLNQAMDVAFDLDLKSLHLNVNRFNKSVKFYEHVGFKTIGEDTISHRITPLCFEGMLEAHLQRQ